MSIKLFSYQQIILFSTNLVYEGIGLKLSKFPILSVKKPPFLNIFKKNSKQQIIDLSLLTKPLSKLMEIQSDTDLIIPSQYNIVPRYI